jgi:hypothetical protein
MTCGIYLLKFNNYDKVYIGKSIDIEGRTKRHLTYLQTNTHYNNKIQQAYIKYGFPEIVILEIAEHTQLNSKEVHWIAKYDSYKKGLNGTAGGDGGSIGEDNIRAKYDRDTYVLILELLANTDWSILEITKELELSWDVVSHISTGSTHKYLEQEFPETYVKMLNNHRMDVKCKYTKDVYVQVLELLAEGRLTQQDIANNLDISINVVISISAGTSHRYLAKEFPEIYQKMKNKKIRNVISPTGEVFTVNKAKDFAEEHSLSRGHLSQLLNGLLKQHKGWTLE